MKKKYTIILEPEKVFIRKMKISKNSLLICLVDKV